MGGIGGHHATMGMSVLTMARPLPTWDSQHTAFLAEQLSHSSWGRLEELPCQQTARAQQKLCALALRMCWLGCSPCVGGRGFRAPAARPSDCGPQGVWGNGLLVRPSLPDVLGESGARLRPTHCSGLSSSGAPGRKMVGQQCGRRRSTGPFARILSIYQACIVEVGAFSIAGRVSSIVRVGGGGGVLVPRALRREVWASNSLSMCGCGFRPSLARCPLPTCVVASPAGYHTLLDLVCHGAWHL